MTADLRARLTVGALLVALLICAWWYLAGMHMAPSELGAQMGHVHVSAWTPRDLAAVFIMWCVMMGAMMLPAAAPMVFAFVGLTRRHAPSAYLRLTIVFVAGYALVWAGYSVLATAAQWGLHQGALISAGGWSTSPYLSAGLLLTAGAFQFTSLKYACLEKCRTPLGFFAYEWRPGPRGALTMGLRHGLYCVACCWAYMALMFVLGVMNVWWMLTLALFVVVEKLAPAPVLIGRVAGVVAIAGALALLAAG
jgi:predicted metal-binding membrane protein